MSQQSVAVQPVKKQTAAKDWCDANSGFHTVAEIQGGTNYSETAVRAACESWVQEREMIRWEHPTKGVMYASITAHGANGLKIKS